MTTNTLTDKQREILAGFMGWNDPSDETEGFGALWYYKDVDDPAQYKADWLSDDLDNNKEAYYQVHLLLEKFCKLGKVWQTKLEAEIGLNTVNEHENKITTFRIMRAPPSVIAHAILSLIGETE